MLSRVAERVYWLARYLERVENTARILSVFSSLLIDLPPRTKLGWRSLVEITGTSKAFDDVHKQTTERAVMRFMLVENNSVSILNMLASARENARTTREIMPSEAFEQINNLYFYAKDNAEKGISRGPRHDLFEEVISSCQQITGMMAGTVSHNEVYRFIRLGRNLERADMTTRILDSGSADLLPDLHLKDDLKDTESVAAEPYENLLWMNVLRSISAYQMYRQNVRDRVNAEDVVMYLLQDREFPRAVAHCLSELDSVVEDLPNNDRVLAQIKRSLRSIDQVDVSALLDNGLFEFIDATQLQIGEIHQLISEAWFLPDSR